MVELSCIFHLKREELTIDLPRLDFGKGKREDKKKKRND
jgi:hypothetical protein